MNENILIVDDEELVLKSLQRVFRREGYNLYMASSGEKALEIMNDVPFDLILSDQRMPQMTGTELLKTVKEKWPQTVRIVLSGYADVEAILAAINIGEVYRFCTKPWEDNALRAVVRRALEQGRVIRLFHKLIDRIRAETPDRKVSAESSPENGVVRATITNHGVAMNEAQVACMLKCVFDFFESASDNGDIAMLSSTLTKHASRLSFTTESGAGAKLTLDMPIEEKE